MSRKYIGFHFIHYILALLPGNFSFRLHWFNVSEFGGSFTWNAREEIWAIARLWNWKSMNDPVASKKQFYSWFYDLPLKWYSWPGHVMPCRHFYIKETGWLIARLGWLHCRCHYAPTASTCSFYAQKIRVGKDRMLEGLFCLIKFLWNTSEVFRSLPYSHKGYQSPPSV